MRLGLLSLSCAVAFGGPIGAEFADRPLASTSWGNRAYQWNANDGGAAPIDAHGWPTTDSYNVLFNYSPWPGGADPAAFQPDVSGVYTFSFSGLAAAVIIGPGLNASVSDVEFNASSGRTSGRVTLLPGGLQGLVMGFADTQRNASAPKGSGLTDFQLHPPWIDKKRAASSCWGAPFLAAALAPFSHLRMMTMTDANYAGPGATYPSMLRWEDRTVLEDATWASGLIRPGAVGMPWEAVVLLAQETGKHLWINGARCSELGESKLRRNRAPYFISWCFAVPDDPSTPASVHAAATTAAYVAALAALMRSGSSQTGGKGVPPGCIIYLGWYGETWVDYWC